MTANSETTVRVGRFDLTAAEVQAFWAMVDKTDGGRTEEDEGCWMWTGKRTGEGYGLFELGTLRGDKRGPVLNAHRTAFILKKGPVPEGQVVCHGPCATLDDTRKCCVNPAHLRAATRAENNADTRKGPFWLPLEEVSITEKEREGVKLFLPVAQEIMTEIAEDRRERGPKRD